MTRLTGATYAKIVVVALLCLVLCGGLFSCSMGCSNSARAANEFFASNFDVAQFENAGNAEVDASEIRNINIQWMAGQVDILVSDENPNKILISEEAPSRIPERQQMRWRVYGDTLQIAYGWEASFVFGCTFGAKRHLVLTLPRELAHHLGTVTLQAASGNYDLESVQCESLNIDIASGNASGTDLHADNLRLNAASGRIDLSGSFSKLIDVNAASGNIGITSTSACPDRANISIASGSVELAVPHNSEFTARVYKVSGDFNCDFSDASIRDDGDTYVVGGGKSAFSVDIISGNVALHSL